MLIIDIDTIFLIIASIVGIFSYILKKEIIFRTLLIILLTRLFVDISVSYIYKQGENNVIYFNIFSVLEFEYFLFFFIQVIKNNLIKKIIKYSLFFLPVICFANIFFFQGIHVFQTYTFVLGAIILDIYGVVYIYETFEKTEIIKLQNEPSFWITIGIIFSFTASVSIIGVLNYQIKLPKELISNMHSILLSVNILFYILFIIAFLCQINIQKFTHNSSQTYS